MRRILLAFILLLGTALFSFADDVDDWVKSQMQLRHVPAVSIAPMIRHEGTIPGFRSVYWRIPSHDISVIVLSNLDRAGLDNLTAGIAVRFVPALMPAYLKRWPSIEQK